MKIATTVAFVASLGLAGAALAQPAPSGGPDAKGNAPIKAVHTVNDGSAKRGANSFTEGQARQHIVNSGYASVSGLAKGDDGVWRGTATKGGATVNVALDFKGNVSEGGPVGGASPRMRHPARRSEAATVAAAGAGSGAGSMTDSTTTTTTTTTADTTTTGEAATHHRRRHRIHHRRHHHHHHHHMMAATGGNGVAMSGIDRDHNGVSDKEDRAAH